MKTALLCGRDRARTSGLARAASGELALVFDADDGPAVVDRLLVAAHAGAFDTLIIDGLALLHPKPLVSLKRLVVLHELGIRVESAAEPWLCSSLGAVRNAIRWLEQQDRLARTSAIRSAVARASLEGRRPGRPRRPMPVVEADRLLQQGSLSIGGAARALGVPESSLRRALALRRDELRLAEAARRSSPEAA